MAHSYLWKPPHSYLFPRPYVAEDIDMVLEQISPFPYKIDMNKEKTKTTAVSVMKNLEWLHGRRESQSLFLMSTGDDFFAVERGQRKREMERREDTAWAELLIAADDAQRVEKRARFQSPQPQKKRKTYRKTPPFNPSLRLSQASRRSSPCPSSSSPLASALRPSEQTSPSEMSVLDR